MAKNKLYWYFVEGECEKCIVEAIKNDYIKSGKVSIFNVLENSAKKIIRLIGGDTVVIFVFDTDCIQSKINKLEENLKKIRRYSERIILIPQIKNFEDELMYATNIKKLVDFTNSKHSSEEDFKKDFLSMNNLKEKLNVWCFDISKFWSRDYMVKGEIEIQNDSHKIKVRKS